MYYNSAVKIPDVKGKIIRKQKGNGIYVLYQYGSVYNPEKRYAIPQRAIIGKVSPDNADYMIPNDRFTEFFPDADIPDTLPEAYRSCCLKLGTFAVIDKVLRDYKLDSMIAKRFGKDAGLLMDLVSYLIVDEDNAGQHYPDYAFRHPLFTNDMRIYSDSKVSRFLNGVTADQIIGFLDDWNKDRDHQQRIYISYDATNKNCQAGDIDILEYGKPKTDTGSPIFNLALAYDKTNRVPLFYEEYGGSIPDVGQLRYMIDKVWEYGYRHVGFILDRGYFSLENIRYMDDNKYSFIMMVKGHKNLARSLIAEHRNTFETNRDCSIRAYRVYGKTIRHKLNDNDTKERYFHLYFNPSNQAAEREKLEMTIERMKTFMDKQLGKELVLKGAYEDYFKLTYKDGKLVSYRERADVIQGLLECCGYFCLITSDEMTAAQALIHYKGRDISEKIFGADKTFLGSRSMRVQSEEALSAKILIEFIALIVRNRMYNLLKETMLKLETRVNYMTVPAAVHELEKIELARRNNGRYRLDHAVSKRQKIILSAFGLDSASIHSKAIEIGNQLRNDKPLLANIDYDTEETEDGEDTFH